MFSDISACILLNQQSTPREVRKMGLLDGKISLVTGGGSGIGRATAQVLGAEGAHVIVADVDEKSCAATVDLIQSVGGQAHTQIIDVSQDGEVRDLIHHIAEDHGRLDVAFNNAGIEGPTAKILEIEDNEWHRVLQVNLTGLFHCMKYEIEQMAKQDSGGSIVSTASVAGLVAIPGASS